MNTLSQHYVQECPPPEDRRQAGCPCKMMDLECYEVTWGKKILLSRSIPRKAFQSSLWAAFLPVSWCAQVSNRAAGGGDRGIFSAWTVSHKAGQARPLCVPRALAGGVEWGKAGKTTGCKEPGGQCFSGNARSAARLRRAPSMPRIQVLSDVHAEEWPLYKIHFQVYLWWSLTYY